MMEGDIEGGSRDENSQVKKILKIGSLNLIYSIANAKKVFPMEILNKGDGLVGGIFH